MDSIRSHKLNFKANLGWPTQAPADSAPAPAVTQVPAQAAAPYPWILNPTIDLLFACGGFFWILFAVLACTGFKADLYGSPAAFWLMAISIVGMHVIGDGHQPATLFRVYGSPVTRKKLGTPVAILGVVAMVLLSLVVWKPDTFLTPLMRIMFAWGVQHTLAQSFGIALVYCFKRKYVMTKIERNIMFCMTQSVIVFLILRMYAISAFGSINYKGFLVPFYGIVPDWLYQLSLVAVQVSVVLFVGMVIGKYVKDKKIFPLPAMLTVMTPVVLPFVAGTAYTLVAGIFLQWWYHASQYLVVTSAFYFKERGLPENVPLSKIASMLWTPVFAGYFGLTFGTGVLMFIVLPTLLSQHFGFSTPVAVMAVLVAANLHHYSSDMLIWKLRDPLIQKLLVA